MINLETPKKHRGLVSQAHQVAMNVLRAELAQVRPRRARVPRRARHARRHDRRPVRLRRRRAAPAPPAYAARRTTGKDEHRQERHQPRLRAVRPWRCAGATSACCCRCRARAWATPPSPRSPTTSSSSGSRACGPAMAITEPGAGSDSANISTTAVLDGDEYVINGEKIYVTAGERADAVVVWATLDKSLGRAAIKSFVVEKGTPGMTRGAARAQARHPGLRHRDDHLRQLPGAEGEPARLPGGRHQAGLRRRHGDLRQHPPAGGRDGRRRGPGLAGADPGAARPRPASSSTTTARRSRSPPPPRPSSSSSPTGRPRTC